MTYQELQFSRYRISLLRKAGRGAAAIPRVAGRYRLTILCTRRGDKATKHASQGMSGRSARKAPQWRNRRVLRRHRGAPRKAWSAVLRRARSIRSASTTLRDLTATTSARPSAGSATVGAVVCTLRQITP